MDTPRGQVSVELEDKIIIARIQGSPTAQMLDERQKAILRLHRDTQCTALLMDDLKMQALSYNEILIQRLSNYELDSLGFRIGIVVPDSRMAYLARLQFSGKNHRIFYNDIGAAKLWLSPESALPQQGRENSEKSFEKVML